MVNRGRARQSTARNLGPGSTRPAEAENSRSAPDSNSRCPQRTERRNPWTRTAKPAAIEKLVQAFIERIPGA